MEKRHFKKSPSDSHEPKAVGVVFDEMLRSDSRFATAYRRYKEAVHDEAKVKPDLLFKEFFPNTELGIELKLITRKPERMAVDDSINCMLIRDGDYHFTAVENILEKKVVEKRHPHVYLGKCINVKRKDDGTLYPTFNHPRYTSCYTFRDFCLDACTELLKVSGLVEKK